MKTVKVTDKEKELGMGLIIIAAFMGFMFPDAAKWILAVLVALGIISWLREDQE